LNRLGVERFGAAGEPFDAARHEAQFYDTNPDATDRRIGQVLLPGYRLGDRLLRPAQVSVIGPAENGAGHEPTERDDERAGTSAGRAASQHQDGHTGG
jgi:molecular chaperone GrpE